MDEDKLQSKIQALVKKHGVVKCWIALQNELSAISDPHVIPGSEIDLLDLSVKTSNCLWRAGIKTMSDCIALVNNPIPVRHYGDKTRDELVRALIKCGYEKELFLDV
jgi:DNA-directed RNA polymerase alpha subunit